MATRPARPRALAWAAYAAGAWALLFAALHAYWAAGGTAGAGTIGGGIEELAVARDPGFVALLWGTGAVFVAEALLALALVRPWGGNFPRWVLLGAAWAVGVGMAAYGALQLAVTGTVTVLKVTGLLSIPGPVDWTGIRWHLMLWDPWWLLGGILFIVAAWSYQRGARIGMLGDISPAPPGR